MTENPPVYEGSETESCAGTAVSDEAEIDAGLTTIAAGVGVAVGVAVGTGVAVGVGVGVAVGSAELVGVEIGVGTLPPPPPPLLHALTAIAAANTVRMLVVFSTVLLE